MLETHSSRRRPRSDSRRRVSRRSDSPQDARIIRGAEILRQQLMNAQKKKDDTRSSHSKTTVHPSSTSDHTLEWKPRTRIQEDTARIREDLLKESTRHISPIHRSRHPAGSRHQSRHRTPSPSLRNKNNSHRTESKQKQHAPSMVLLDDETTFENLWDTPTRNLKQVPLQDANTDAVTAASFGTPNDADQWADLAVITASDRVQHKPRSPALAAVPVVRTVTPPPAPRKGDTPLVTTSTTTITSTVPGLRVYESLFNADEEEEEEEGEDTYDFVENDYDDDDIDIALAAYKDHSLQYIHSSSSNNKNNNYLPRNLSSKTRSKSESRRTDRPATAFQPHQHHRIENGSIVSKGDDDDDDNNKSYNSPTSTIDLTPPTLAEYSVLRSDPAYMHAQTAGFLWQSLVGQHVRFPFHWWDGARGPPMGAFVEDTPWLYLMRTPVYKHALLKKVVRNRAAPGRLLLHVLITQNNAVVMDMAVGCFHPNARGIRADDATHKIDKSKEAYRDVWMAVRKRNPKAHVLDSWRMKHAIHKRPIEQKVTNANVRVVFGEQPPMETIVVPEEELHERLRQYKNPALELLEDFVFS